MVVSADHHLPHPTWSIDYLSGRFSISPIYLHIILSRSQEDIFPPAETRRSTDADWPPQRVDMNTRSEAARVTCEVAAAELSPAL